MKVDNFVVLESVYGKFIVPRTCLFQAEALVKTGRTHIESELSNIFENDVRLDIRKRVEIAQVIKKINPEVIIHLAAQPLVRESYKYPVETFDINVLGTLNILEATKQVKNLKATLVITTDKVYKNHNHLRGYVETDELGGDDPYSASKAAADIATQSWIKSFATI